MKTVTAGQHQRPSEQNVSLACRVWQQKSHGTNGTQLADSLKEPAKQLSTGYKFGLAFADSTWPALGLKRWTAVAKSRYAGPAEAMYSL